MPKVKVSMTIDEEILDKFKKHCKRNGMKVSTIVEVFMRNRLKVDEL